MDNRLVFSVSGFYLINNLLSNVFKNLNTFLMPTQMTIATTTLTANGNIRSDTAKKSEVEKW